MIVDRFDIDSGSVDRVDSSNSMHKGVGHSPFEGPMLKIPIRLALYGSPGGTCTSAGGRFLTRQLAS